MTGCHIKFISELTDPGYSSSCYDVKDLYTVYLDKEVGIWLIQDGYQMIRMIAEPVEDYSLDLPNLVIKYDETIRELKRLYEDRMVKEIEVKLYAAGGLHIYINKDVQTIIIRENEIPEEDESTEESTTNNE